MLRQISSNLSLIHIQNQKKEVDTILKVETVSKAEILLGLGKESTFLLLNTK